MLNKRVENSVLVTVGAGPEKMLSEMAFAAIS